MRNQANSPSNRLTIHLPHQSLGNKHRQSSDNLDTRFGRSDNIQTQTFQHRTIIERTYAYDGKLCLSCEIEWGKTVGDEVW